jgi:hypothetical protein
VPTSKPALFAKAEQRGGDVGRAVDTVSTSKLKHLSTAVLHLANNVHLQPVPIHFWLDASVQTQRGLFPRCCQSLCDAPARESPEQRFARTTAGLEGTDSVTSVLVSHVEALVAKVEALQIPSHRGTSCPRTTNSPSSPSIRGMFVVGGRCQDKRPAQSCVLGVGL